MIHRAKKSLGQNFLVDSNTINKIIRIVSEGQPKSILEIGPGQGALTKHLVGLARQLVLVEKDSRLVQVVIPRLVRGIQNMNDGFQPREAAPLCAVGNGNTVQIIESDFLKLNLDEIFEDSPGKTTVVGNLPYNVASPILIKLLKHRKYFDHLFLMFQKEVATRIIAKPGSKDYSLLSLWSQIYSEPKKCFDLSPNVFNPKPKVHSSFVSFKMKDEILLSMEQEDHFWNLMAHLFQNRRKMIGSVLKSKGYVFDNIANTLLKERAENLGIEELVKFSQMVKKYPIAP